MSDKKSKDTFKDMCSRTSEALKSELLDVTKALFNLRFQKKVDASQVKPHVVKMLKKQVARLKTALHIVGE